MKYSPILLFVYNRPRHTARTLEALAANSEAKASQLVIISDGPRSDTDIPAIAEVRRLIRRVKGFGSVDLIERQENAGLAQSIISGVTQMCSLYERVVVLEDDIITSSYFLDYMNQSLLRYAEDEKVISVGCFVFPVRQVLPETFFFRVPDCWGWGVWKRSWSLFEQDGGKLLAEIRSRNLQSEFDLGGAYPYTKMLEAQISGKNNSWAIRWYASAFLSGKLSLYPGQSMTKNIGMDATGVHSGNTTQYDVEPAKRAINVQAIPVIEDDVALNAIRNALRHQLPGPVSRIRNHLGELAHRIIPTAWRDRQ